MSSHPDISIVIPLLNEKESIVPLHEWIVKVLSPLHYSFEILFIDDGSTDGSWQVIEQLTKVHAFTHGLSFLRNFGKSQALHAGFHHATGTYVVTLDADLQDSPDEIPKLIQTLQEKNLDLISGWKRIRFDSFLFKNLPSKLFNWAARRVSGIRLHDFNCGIKAYRSEVIKSIDVYGEMHRYIPVLAAKAGFDKIGEQVVVHQARQFGTTKFGVDRFFKGFLDLITLWFLNSFGKNPMYFFGLFGSLLLFFGFIFTAYLGFDKLYLDVSGRLITERPEFYIALTLMIIGSQFFIAGFLGELILRKPGKKDRYTITRNTKKNEY